VPFRGKTGFLLAASNGQVGGIRGLQKLRIPLEGLGVLLHSDMYTLPWAEKAFGPEGRLIDQERRDRLAKMVQRYLTVARKLAAD
jgi:NAD(P)H-dependent FMN reductase